MSGGVLGRVHSVQSMGTLDGPGVRFVVFLQGCNLRCKCCHNPDTWDITGGAEFSADQIVQKAERFREYFGEKGGITISGGEPLLQAEFCAEVFKKCHEKGINTCLDTSGSVMNDKVKALIDLTDRVLLDVKYTDGASYRENVGCGIEKPLEFLDYLNRKGVPTTIRQVIIPTKNDNAENMARLKKIVENHAVVDKVELLPFKKICQVKYDNMGITFPFGDIPEPTPDKMAKLNNMMK